MEEHDYDLFVIGAGSGGVRAARMAAEFGARVAVAEDRYMGGTCVNVGCVPKKLYVYAAEFGKSFTDARNFGWDSERSAFNWATLRDNKKAEISRLNGVYDNLLAGVKVEVISGRARIVDAHTVAVGEQRYSAEKILIATGGWPHIPEFPGSEHAISSNEVFDLAQFPRRLAIVGGGYIAVEFANIFHGLGVETTLIYRGMEILGRFDMDLRRMLHADAHEEHVDPATRRVQHVAPDHNGGHKGDDVRKIEAGAEERLAHQMPVIHEKGEHQRQEEIPECRRNRRNDEQEDHDRAVEREHPVVGSRAHDGAPGGQQLEADEQREHAAHEERQDHRDQVHHPDALVIERREPGPDALARDEVVLVRINAAVRIGGVAYLLWLAHKLTRARQLGEANAELLHVGFWQGVTLQFVNIKAWMLALAIVGGWIAGRADATQRLVLVVPIMLGFAFASNCCYALVGSALRTWLIGPNGDGQRLVWFNRGMAVVLLVTALWMLVL